MNNKNKLLNNKRAFTLIELLIVIAIIGILFVVLISKVDFAADKANATGVQTDFRSFHMAFDIVAREHQGFTELINTDYEKLEKAINKHLDTSLKIDIDENGKITLANGTTDPWKVPYHGAYIAGTDGKDRGAIIMYSNGANMLFGSDASLASGVVTFEAISENGKDDYAIVSCYSLNNGYGAVFNTSVGFSNNKGDLLNDGGNHDVPSIPEEPFEPLNEYGFYYNKTYWGYVEGEMVGFMFHEDGQIDLIQDDVVINSVPAGTFNYEWKYCDGGIYFSEDGKSFEMDDAIFSINMIMVEVSNTKIEVAEDLVVSIEHTGLVSVTVNGEKLSNEHYTVTDNTVITIKESYIDTLSNGMYQLAFNFSDGSNAVCSVMMKRTIVLHANVTLKIGEVLELLTFRKYSCNVDYTSSYLTEVPDTSPYITLKAKKAGTTEVVFTYYPDSNWVDYEWENVKHIVYYNITIEENPELYYENIPYTFTLDDSDHWVDGIVSVNDVRYDDYYCCTDSHFGDDVEITCEGSTYTVYAKVSCTVTFEICVGTPANNYTIKHTITFNSNADL